MLYKLLARIVLPAFPEIIWKKSGDPKNLYLTFDDGPDPDITPRILQILKRYRVPAVFFLLGEKLELYKNNLKQINYQGHKIGNHGYSHYPLILSPRIKMHDDIQQTDRLIQSEFMQKTAYFRPPYGIWGPAITQELKNFHKRMVLWSLMAFDFKWNADKVMAHLSRSVTGGDIIVFHDNHQSRHAVVEALPDFIKLCQSRGFNFRLL
ncbi:MAG: polysaccharide deacetylase family protein [bacterium]|nr:MAG: polysaccharide deacetylase family protein [bacterium]